MRTRLALLLAPALALSACRDEGAPRAGDRAAAAGAAASASAKGTPAVIIDHTVQTLDGKTASLASYRGKAMLIVNTASECGYTPQYAGLERLHEAYAARGLVVLGFPCNDFGAQEPGSAETIQSFCETRFGVKFPLFAKVKAKGPDKAPLYRTLTEDTPDGIRGEVKWNFTKFLVDPAGHVVARFEPKVEPESAEVKAAIEKVLPR